MSPTARPSERGPAQGRRKTGESGPASAPVHLLLGPEEGQKAEFIERITKGIVSRLGGERPEVSRFYAGESRMAEVVLRLRNQGLFCRHRLVIVGNVEEVSRAEEARTLAEYCGAPATDATLILASPGFAGEVDKRIAAAVPKENVKIFWEMFDNQKQGWVANFFRQRGRSIEPAAIQYILDMVENNTRDLRVECERLAQFFGPDAPIGLDSVEQYITHTKEENVFTLFDRVCEKELGPAEEVLDKILLSREAEPTQIASMLLVQFRKLASLKRLLAENYELAEAFPKVRLFTKKSQKTYLEGNRNYTERDIEAIILLLAEFEERFRSIKADLHALLLHMLVYYIVHRAGQGAWRHPLD
jgi:DNA polymerase-3 subunit delta